MPKKEPCGCGRMKEDEAKRLARGILGPRAILWTDEETGERCVGRFEQSIAGFRERRLYGRGTKWITALRAAKDRYDEMRAQPELSS